MQSGLQIVKVIPYYKKAMKSSLVKQNIGTKRAPNAPHTRTYARM